MKLTIALTAALIGGVALPAIAFADTVIRGCAMLPIEGTNAFQKADPTCVFANAANETGTGKADAPGKFVLTPEGIVER